MSDPIRCSVVLVAPDCYDTIRVTIRHLRAQTVRGQLELVIVSLVSQLADLDESELSDFGAFQVVYLGPVSLLAMARAAGARHARAPVVAFAEDHSLPEPGWAKALLEAHDQGFAAVGPAVVNANPRTMLSWAGMFMSFAPWADRVTAGIVEGLAWHNTSYKRALLLEYGAALDDLLAEEGFLQADLRARGHQLYLEPAARVRHFNCARFSAWIREKLHAGRAFAAARVRYDRWSIPRRTLYGLGALLIPAARLRRILWEIRRCGRRKELLPRILPALLLGLYVHAIGEMIGYLFGAGDAPKKKSAMEFHRDHHLSKHDRSVLSAEWSASHRR
jgi:hypothetical protein